MMEHNLRLAIKRRRGFERLPVTNNSAVRISTPRAFSQLDSMFSCSEAFLNYIRKKGFSDRRSYTTKLVESICQKQRVQSIYELLGEVGCILDPPGLDVEPTGASCSDVTVVVAHVLATTPYMPFAERLIASFLAEARTVSSTELDVASGGNESPICALQNGLVEIAGTTAIRLAIRIADSELVECYKEWCVSDAKGLLTLMAGEAFPALKQANVEVGGSSTIKSNVSVQTGQSLTEELSKTLTDESRAGSIRVQSWKQSIVNHELPPDIETIIPEVRSMLGEQFSDLNKTCIDQGLAPAARWVVLLSYLELTTIHRETEAVFQTVLLDGKYEAYIERLLAVVDVACDMSPPLRIHSTLIIRHFTATQALKQKTMVDRSFYIPYFLSREHVLVIKQSQNSALSLFLRELRAFFSNPMSFKESIIGRIEFSYAPLVYSPRKPECHRCPSRPVLLFDFSGAHTWNYERLVSFIDRTMLDLVRDEALKSPWTGKEANWNDRFVTLIHRLHWSRKETIVVLVDEYDRPFLNCNHVSEIENMARVFEQMFRTIKCQCAHILLCVATAASHSMSKHVSFNYSYLVDYTWDPDLACLLGLTESEAALWRA